MLSPPAPGGSLGPHGQQRGQQEVDQGPSWVREKLNQPGQSPPKKTLTKA